MADLPIEEEIPGVWWKRNGPGASTDLMIALARQPFTILDAAAQAINLPVAVLLNALDLAQLESCEEGS
jgi:hypothetical protein